MIHEENPIPAFRAVPRSPHFRNGRNDKSFQLWYNNGVDRDGKAPTEEAGSRLIRTDDFKYTHVILWVTCGLDGAAAMTYELDDAQLFCVSAK